MQKDVFERTHPDSMVPSGGEAVMATVTRAELAEAACLHGAVTKTEARGLVDQCLTTISDALVAGETVGIYGFGSFNVRQKAAQGGGRNPMRPDEAHAIPARRVVVFRAGRGLKNAVDDGMRGSGWVLEAERRATAGSR
jgi:nucleoid DNA-binding protein